MPHMRINGQENEDNDKTSRSHPSHIIATLSSRTCMDGTFVPSLLAKREDISLPFFV